MKSFVETAHGDFKKHLYGNEPMPHENTSTPKLRGVVEDRCSLEQGSPQWPKLKALAKQMNHRHEPKKISNVFKSLGKEFGIPLV